MKKTLIGLSMAALVLGGSAYAAPGTPTMKRDADGNGVLTRAEAQTAAASAFARMDANKDGTLDQTDRTARMEAMKSRMFDRLDANKDGQITRAEFTAERTPRDGARAGRAHKRGQMAAARRGGRMNTPMTQAQFVAAAIERFDAADTNKDGQVTQAEREQRKAQRQQARAQRNQG